MSIHPNSSFPLLASDQADVIRIFLDLMSKNERAEHSAGSTSSQPVGPRNESNDPSFPGNLLDLE